jgi:uncharacterized protein YigA (DUF484 family)
MRIDQEEIWRDARPAVLEGVKGLSLSPEVALLFHVGHQADHYFGPTLKWVLDLREMLRRWAPDPARVAQKSRAWGLRTALDLALAHLEKILPGEDKVLRSAVPPDRLKRRLMGPFLSHEPIPLFHPDRSPVASLALRPLLFDRLTDLVFVSMQVATRPPARLWGRLAGRVPRPWDGAGGAD